MLPTTIRDMRVEKFAIGIVNKVLFRLELLIGHVHYYSLWVKIREIELKLSNLSLNIINSTNLMYIRADNTNST